MAQETLVVKLRRDEGEELRRKLSEGAFEFRSVPHALFSAKGEGVVATLYGSGKLVVQGSDARGFLLRFLEREPPAPSASTSGAKSGDGPGEALVEELERAPLVGSDEAGKGDWFGPLVVAAVRVEPEDAARLRAGGVMDSKRLSDRRVLEMAGGLRARFAHAVARLDPADYNRAHEQLGNLNPLLARLHGQAIRAVARGDEAILIDRFADEALMRSELAELPNIESRLHQIPRGERAMAVAAASVLARAAFLEGLSELSAEVGVELPKGAGAPVDAAGRALLALHPRERLREVAKLHFRNTSKLAGRR